MHWRRKWQPTLVFLPGESQRRGTWSAAVYGVAQSRTQLKRLSRSCSSTIKFMANRREMVDAVTDFIFLGSKITADGDSSHEIKRRLLLVRKAMTHLDSILKSKDHFADKS